MPDSPMPLMPPACSGDGDRAMVDLDRGDLDGASARGSRRACSTVRLAALVEVAPLQQGRRRSLARRRPRTWPSTIERIDHRAAVLDRHDAIDPHLRPFPRRPRRRDDAAVRVGRLRVVERRDRELGLLQRVADAGAEVRRLGDLAKRQATYVSARPAGDASVDDLELARILASSRAPATASSRRRSTQPPGGRRRRATTAVRLARVPERRDRNVRPCRSRPHSHVVDPRRPARRRRSVRRRSRGPGPGSAFRRRPRSRRTARASRALSRGRRAPSSPARSPPCPTRSARRTG